VRHSIYYLKIGELRLQNENIRNQIAVNGNEEALRKHTLENRAVRILKDAHLIQ
jgi:hypothetical protein